MNEKRLLITIDKPVSEVFAFTLNPLNTPLWVDVVAEECASENPTRLGTVYKNKDTDGNWSEFEVTAFENEKVFELTKKDDNHHVRYTFHRVNTDQCELEYGPHPQNETPT